MTTRTRQSASLCIARATSLILMTTAVLAACSEPQTLSDNAAPAPPTVMTGLDSIARGDTPVPQGRLGLIVHSASVTDDGRHAIDVFQERGADVVALFSPEHGLRGQAAAGEEVSSSIDQASGLPVHSLYGKTRKPSAETLAPVDALVFDLQGGGVRFYTYVSTLLLALEAAAENDVALIVLDRPNPISGVGVAGPANDLYRDQSRFSERSFLAMAPGPLVHGLTLGEMARLANLELQESTGASAELTVVPMVHYRRSMSWRATGRDWLSPSPNLRSPEAALMYPGTALFEATNVSEGRGTKQPFLWFGAPWFDDGLIERLIAAAPAEVELRKVTLHPRSSAAAPQPKYLDRECRGLEISLTLPQDGDTDFDPFATGLLWLAIVAEHPAFEWRDGGMALTRLIGSEKPLAALRNQGLEGVERYLSQLEQEHLEWLERSRPALLYR